MKVLSLLAFTFIISYLATERCIADPRLS